MEEVNRTPQPGEAPLTAAQQSADHTDPAPWVRLEPGAFSGSWQLHRGATIATAGALHARPQQRGLHLVVRLAGLALPLFCLVAGFSLLFQGIQPVWWFCALPWIVYFLLVFRPFYLFTFLRLWRSLDRFPGATLDATRLHLDGPDGGQDYPLADLTLLWYFGHWTALVWQREEELVVLPIPDKACPDGAKALFTKLRQTAPNATQAIVQRPWLHWLGALLLLLLQTLVLFVSFVLFAEASSGLQLLISANWQGGAATTLLYDHRNGMLHLPGKDTAPVPVAGEPTIRWQSDTCCAVTYQSPDGTLGVQLVDGTASRSAVRLDPDPPTGSWAQYPIFSNPGITLRWDADNSCYRLLTDAGESVYTDWQEFDGLGLALCDDSGQPEWTLTADRGKFWDPDNVNPEGPVLLLYPVTMDDYATRTPLYPVEEEVSAPDTTVPAATPAPAETALPAPSPTAAPEPTFDDTVDVCLNEGGLYFTWDGGATYSHPLNHSECTLYSLGEVADLEPLVLRQDLAAFLVTIPSSDVTAYVTTDQGQSWQTTNLVHWPYEPDIAHRCLGFTEDGFGYAAVSTDVTEGGDITMAIFTTQDGGASWQTCADPKPDIDATRPITGLIFCDEQTALASMASGDDNPWPHIFSTLDGGATWKELPVNFASSGLTVATRLTGFTRQGDEWRMTVTQEPYGRQDLVFRANAPDGPWAYVKP